MALFRLPPLLQNKGGQQNRRRMPTEEEENTFLTHTFSECVENHAGMQTLGCKHTVGLSEEDVAEIAAKLPELCTLHKLEMNCEHASVVVFHGGVDFLLGKCGADELMQESKDQPFDSQFLNVRRKIVQNKHGRLNNCYADLSQEPNIPEGKGTVIAFGCAPKISELRDRIPRLTGIATKGLYAETNKYVDVRKRQVGVGFHGDGERSIVVGVRLGKASMPLRFQWYNRAKPISDEYVIDLKHGDMYCMSWKATGHDWKCSSKTTLRHGVGRKAVKRKIGH